MAAPIPTSKINAAEPVALYNQSGAPISASAPLPIQPTTGQGLTASFSFTPAAAAYSANDIFDSAKEIAFGATPNGSAVEILIYNTRLRVDANALQASEASYTLHLYSVTPPSALSDNGAWDLPSGDRASYLGSITLGTPVDVGSTCFIEQTDVKKGVTLPAGGSLYGYLVTSAAFTPTAAARTVVLKAVIL